MKRRAITKMIRVAAASTTMALPRQLRYFCLVLSFTGSLAMGAESTGLTVTKVIKSKVDVSMTIKGAWGTFINGKSYQQMPLDTYKGWQYTTYYDQKQRLSIARRKLPGGSWQVIHFDDYLFKSNDNHNVTVLGICRKDGTIHLAFDIHPHRFIAEIVDSGRTFDFSSYCPPSFPQHWDQGNTRGVGLYLIKQCMDEVSYYQLEDRRNKIRLVKHSGIA